MQDKKEKTEKLLKKIKCLVKLSINKKQYGKAMSAISFIGNYLYQYNQFYADDELEAYLREISFALKDRYKIQKDFQASNKIVFYDGFGLNTRGVALMYLNALGLNNYPVIYVTNKKCKDTIPSIKSMCNKYGFEMKFINMNDYLEWSKQICDIFMEFEPRAAFFYTKPNDVSAIVAFQMFEGNVERYLIDLTDHAFWLGKTAADYFLGSRNMSASLQYYQRGIDKKKMIKLGVNLLVEPCDDHDGLPFDPLTTKYVFSGGALYKTLGDSEKKYYKIVNYILEHHPDINFLYAGAGDNTELKKIVDKYPNRAYHIKERKDFYYLIQNCVLYLNTYPMFGGMMMKYCGMAKKIPITLKHGNDSDGLLLNQRACRIEYTTFEELVSDVDDLLSDEEYRKSREELLIDSVITEERFKKNVRSVIEEHKSDYNHEYLEIDTKPFRDEYYKRFDYNTQMEAMVKYINLSLFSSFPMTFISGFLRKVYKKILEEIGD